jgi:hypothetical protein
VRSGSGKVAMAVAERQWQWQSGSVGIEHETLVLATGIWTLAAAEWQLQWQRRHTLTVTRTWKSIYFSPKIVFSFLHCSSYLAFFGFRVCSKRY